MWPCSLNPINLSLVSDVCGQGSVPVGLQRARHRSSDGDVFATSPSQSKCLQYSHNDEDDEAHSLVASAISKDEAPLVGSTIGKRRGKVQLN